jgi:hypothetical protein
VVLPRRPHGAGGSERPPTDPWLGLTAGTRRPPPTSASAAMSVSVARASWSGRAAAGKSVGAAKSVGQSLAACHVADQVGGLMAGHPGGGDKQRPGGAFPAHYRHGVGGGAEGCLGDADDRHPKLGVGMRAQAGPAGGVQVGVAVDDQQTHAVQTVQDRMQWRQFAQVELAGMVGRHLGHLPGAVGQRRQKVASSATTAAAWAPPQGR